jgi:nucleotide-binding universal stress UspA family protein
VGRLLRSVAEAVVGPRAEVGAWRREVVERRGDNRLFPRILVAVGGDAPIWPAIEWAVEVARREGGILRGLHVTPQEPESGGRNRTQEFRRRLRGRRGGEMAWEPGVRRTASCSDVAADLVVVTCGIPRAGLWPGCARFR